MTLRYIFIKLYLQINKDYQLIRIYLNKYPPSYQLVYVHHRQMYLTEIIALTAFTLLYTCTYVHKITSRQHKALRVRGNETKGQ